MDKKVKFNNILFFIVIFTIIIGGWSALIRNEKDISYSENRNLAKFPHLTISGYLNSEYQRYFADALSDQFLYGQTIKEKYKTFSNFLSYDDIPEAICKNKYVSLNSEYASFNCDKSIILKYNKLQDDVLTAIQNRLKVYSQLNNYIDTYYFFLSTAAIYNFEKNEYSIDILKIVDENLKGDYNISSLTFRDFDEFKKYFYKTDHHWNNVGSYNAYKKIINMMSDEEPLKPIDEITFDDTVFYGSAARNTQIYDFKEKFKAYKFNIPKYSVTVDLQEGSYGLEDEYFKGNYDRKKWASHYGLFYGGDNGELIFDFNAPDKDNVLVLGSSYTNAINKLISSHFNKTYIIDLRNYSKIKGEEFNIKKYIDEHNIDKVLIIFDYIFLHDPDFDIEWRA